MGSAEDSVERELEITRHVIAEFVQQNQATLREWFHEEISRSISRDEDLQWRIDQLGAKIEAATSRVPELNHRGIIEWVREALSVDSGLLRRGIDQIVSDAVAREVMATYTRDRVAWGDWTRAFSFESQRVPSDPLESVERYLDTPVGVELPPLLLDRPLQECVRRDPHPLPATEDREGYSGPRHYEFWQHGLKDYRQIVGTLERHGVKLEPGSGVFDFGCATGRVLRHFLCQEDGLEIWGADINRNHIEWMNRYLPRGPRFFQCTILPHLPMADNSLRLVYALSVFTHIDEYEFAWLAELARVLEPGGVAYLTVVTDDTWKKIGPHWTVYNELLANRDVIQDYEVTEELFAGPMPREKVVFRWRTATMNNTTIFVSKDYIHRNWGRFLDVLEIIEQGSGYQDVVVLRKG